MFRVCFSPNFVGLSLCLKLHVNVTWRVLDQVPGLTNSCLFAQLAPQVKKRVIQTPVEVVLPEQNCLLNQNALC